MKNRLLIFSLCLLFSSTQAQILNPVNWSYGAKKISATEAVLYLKATMDSGWHIYSVNQKDGGPLKTSFKFAASSGFVLIGNVMEPKPISKFEEVYGLQVDYFKKEVVFQQSVKLKKPDAVVKGKIEYMACTDKQCTPPLEVEFSIPVK
ncbi:protein-disulfide reductase DsbD domain-containing protein [Pedobacter africanus]|uniref:Disulphide bond corrector protein DsbC n=1 Tax=Pedobacter africanus TaxID=151894 RepID=A0A1W2B038_9SPHI|nr:protein-disulfide reductase DsbD domain-containing protein [Pedobacter africanus]SMC66214.1 Disulphide bond corrector protein DsbC [Pedobacter africanus]